MTPRIRVFFFAKSLKTTSKSKDEFPNFSSPLFIFGCSFFFVGGELKVWTISISAIAAWHALPFTMAVQCRHDSAVRPRSPRFVLWDNLQFLRFWGCGCPQLSKQKKKEHHRWLVFSSNVGNNMLTCLFFWTPRKGLLNCSSPCFYRPFWTKV